MKKIHCNSYGVPLRVELADESLLPSLADLLPFGTKIGSDPHPDAQAFAISSAVPSEQFAREIMIHVANFAPDRVFVHAGVVGWRNRALLLPGPSFAGKSTLTAALVRAGATYYSDEYAVIDEAGWIHPYPRDLQMREPGNHAQTALPASSLCGAVGVAPLRAAQVVFARYKCGAFWSPQPLTHGMALLEMLRHSIPVQRTPARVMSTLSRMLDGATAWTSDRDDAADTAQHLLSALEEQLFPATPPPQPVGAQQP
jgi:hypothetical protein